MKSKNENYQSQITEKLPDANENACSESKRSEELSDLRTEHNRVAVDKLEECICTAKVGEDYILTCTVPDRGNHTCIYNAQTDTLIATQNKTQKEYEIVFSEVAHRTLKKAVEKAERIISRLPITDGATFNYERNGSKYTLVFLTTENEIKTISIFSELDFATVIEKLRQFSIYQTAPTTVSELEQNPFFDLAKQKNDDKTQIWLENYYLKWYANFKKYQNEKHNSKQLLPIVSEEFDKDFIVDADTVNITLLSKNGYTIHRVSTYTNYGNPAYWTLNPYKRTAIEGAKDTSNAMIFSDYLDQFSNLT